MLWLLLAACDRSDEPETDGPVDSQAAPSYDHLWGETLGDAIPGTDTTDGSDWLYGRGNFKRDFSQGYGLGPAFSSDACSNCHGAPVIGGHGATDRDVWLVYTADGEPAGTKDGAVRNAYVFASQHVPDPQGAVFVRRNAPAVFGAGLFERVDDDVLRGLADPDDADGDGISGKTAELDDGVGRYGWKAQHADVESTVAACAWNHQGLTRLRSDADNDADPELVDDEWIPLTTYVRLLAPPRPTGEHDDALAQELGCLGCHVRTLESDLGPLPAYTDLLLHDMGPELAEALDVAGVGEQEFRTPALWGVGMGRPWLHDGRAETLDAAIRAHGGEAAATSAAYAALDEGGQAELVAWLESLGTPPELELPVHDEYGGPLDAYDGDADWLAGYERFVTRYTLDDGLGPDITAESCVVCHMDQAPGGAGGVDAGVFLVEGAERTVLDRAQLYGQTPWRLPEDASIELRHPPTLLGLGTLEAIEDATIEALADPDDADGDGISGRVHRLDDGSLGRFGWEARWSSLDDAVRDELDRHMGITSDEVRDEDVDALVTFVRGTAPPPDRPALDDDGAERGDALFDDLGCPACHVRELDGVTVYSDLLLHDLGSSDGLDGELRTAPLKGLGSTYPYGHDGWQRSLLRALMDTHGGEADETMGRFGELSDSERSDLAYFLLTL